MIYIGMNNNTTDSARIRMLYYGS